MVSDFRAAHTAEKFLCPIRASAVKAVSLFMIDALHFKAAMQLVPICGLVSIHNGPLGDAGLDER